MTTTLRTRLREQLTAARKGGDRPVAAAVRAALAAIENAEAVDPADVPAGSTEAERRTVSATDEEALVRAEVDDLRAAVTTYAALGRTPEATSAARAADVLATLVDEVAMRETGR